MIAMFSVVLLYAIRDFLKLSNSTKLLPKDFQKYFRMYKYADATKILEVSFKCGWVTMNTDGIILLTERGKYIMTSGYKYALVFQLEDMISEYNPTWASVIPRGRQEVKCYVPEDVNQCFREAGLFDELSEDVIAFWDRLSLAYRKIKYERNNEVGRLGEKLSYQYEYERTGKYPKWQSVESNLSGYDLLSIVGRTEKGTLQIEVKATTSQVNHASLYISRNEWDTALSSSNYTFHLWELKNKPILHIVTVEQMKKHVPLNNGFGLWESTSIPYSELVTCK